MSLSRGSIPGLVDQNRLVKILVPYRKCAGVMLHRLTRRFRAGALVGRALRFYDSYVVPNSSQ